MSWHKNRRRIVELRLKGALDLLAYGKRRHQRCESLQKAFPISAASALSRYIARW
jgi:hypothetical protein